MIRIMNAPGQWPKSLQFILHAKPVTGVAESDSTECVRIWDPVRARLETCALPYVLSVPAVFSILVLVLLVLRVFLPISLPLWARNIVKEEHTKIAEQDVLPPSQRLRRLSYELGLSLLSTAGLLAVVPAVIARTQWGMTVPHAASWGVLLFYIVAARPKTASAALGISYILIFVADLIILGSDGRLSSLEKATWSISAAMAALSLVLTLMTPLRHPALSSEEVSKPFTAPTSALRSPEDDLTPWQWMTVSWMNPMIKAGKARQLHFEDVWSLAFEFEHSRLHAAFRTVRGSVFRRLMAANGIDLILTTLYGLVQVCMEFVTPVLLQQLLRALQDTDRPKRAALIFAVLSMIAQVVDAQATVLGLWYSRRVYERSRGEMITMLYEKTLSRSIVGENVSIGDKDEKSASTGKVLNIMRGDAYEVAQRFWEWTDIINTPLRLVIGVYLVWKIIGWPCLLGALVVLGCQILNIGITKILVYYEEKRKAATDDKLKILTQYIESLRHLRYNAWEQRWLDGILSARQKELYIRIKSNIFTVLLTLSNSLALGLFPVFAFMALTLLAGRQLTVDIAFPALQLFNILEGNLQNLPNLITTLLNASVAMRRIETFMKEPDRENLASDEELNSSPTPIQIDHVSFAWPGLDKPVLENIAMEIPVGITVVHGKVGSGKSALLQALLGELNVKTGEYHPPSAMVAYCSQTPWLQNMSIRDNIIFDNPFDRDRYTNVLAACALTTDLASFTNGDLSFIGENGIGLSGGQKARVALARAIYSNAPFLFLDDPISALDQQTAEHIAKQCIGGPLCKGRSIILVTHRLDLIQGLANKVILMKNGHATIQDATLVELEDETDDLSAHARPNQNSDDNVVDGKAFDDAADAADAVKDKFIEEEYRAHGSVNFKVYWGYVKAGGLTLWTLLTFTMILSRLSSVAENWFLKEWGESYDRIDTQWSTDFFSNLPRPDENIRPWLFYFAVIALVQSLTYAVFRLVMTFITYKTGKNIFHDIMICISNASFRFYDVTPVGRLMNRMTGDVQILDGPICDLLFRLGFSVTGWVSSIIVIASVTRVFFIFALLTTFMFAWIFSQFLPASQNLRRLEMVSLSPLMANFGTLIEGLVTVRAFRAQRRFQAGVIRVVDTFQKMDHFYWSLQAWVMIRLEFLAATSTLILTLIAIYTDTSPGLTAFVLMAAASYIRNTYQMCQVYGQMELEFTSVERVIELLHVQQEPKGDNSPPASWPMSGEIEFDHVDVRYAPHLDLVLKDISLKIPGGSNVAVVGRTGSGKSTMALAMLATVRPSTGRILLDGIDICSIEPTELRRRITFLAQEPTLFVGTMHMNLDPLEEFSADECAAVLARLGGDRHGWTLETAVDGGGKNLSQGQRQLVQLARAILRRSPLVILDEATASIDLGTSLEVQDILRQEMSRSTVITIAHRVEAVSNANLCVELAHGRVIAQGPPGNVATVRRTDQGEGE